MKLENVLFYIFLVLSFFLFIRMLAWFSVDYLHALYVITMAVKNFKYFLIWFSG